MKRGLLFFSQGWTDIINQLPIIDYYLSIYDSLTVILRPAAKPIYEFYLKERPNLIKEYFMEAENSRLSTQFLYKNFDINLYDYLLHGPADYARTNIYQNSFRLSVNNSSLHNVKKFYELYGIDFSNKIKYFQFERDIESEENFYNKFIKEYNLEKSEYILYHQNNLNDSTISFNRVENISYINLDGRALDIFFTIKILQNAKELHLIDSVWASFCYLIDAKYQLLKNIPVYLYPFKIKGRWGGLLKDITYKNELKLEPLHLDNWVIVS